MTLQISPIGYAIMAVLYIVVFLILAVTWRVVKPRIIGKTTLFVIGLAILIAPWVEEVWIAYHYARHCEDAGVHVTREVEVEGFYDATMRTGYELIDRYGFQFMEHPSHTKGKVDHITRLNGVWKKSVYDQPQARYHYKRSYQPTRNRYEEPVGWKILKSETQVIDSQTNEVIGRDTVFTRSPNTVESLWVRYLGSGGSGCLGPLDEPEKHNRIGLLYKYVLLPKKLEK